MSLSTSNPSKRPITPESAQRFYDALSEIALADEANEWARKRATNALYVVTDPPPPDALELGRKLAERYRW